MHPVPPSQPSGWPRPVVIAVISGVVVFVLIQLILVTAVIRALNSDDDKRDAGAVAHPSSATPATPPPRSSPSRRPSDSRQTQAPPPAKTPKATPTATVLAWRLERLADESTRMVFGDVDAAPRDPTWVGGSDYHQTEADGKEKIIKVTGWWCAVKVDPNVTLSGSSLRNGGVTASCTKRPRRMRLQHQFTRSSWTGMRSYTDHRPTSWTSAQSQSSGPLSAPCPAGRTGTYDYQVRVLLELDGYPTGQNPASSNDRYRGNCGTGVG